MFKWKKKSTEAAERIAFQAQSALATRIVSLCQQTLDQIKATRHVDSNGNIIKAGNARIKQVAGYMKTTFSPELIKICDEELNLHIYQLDLSLEMVYNNSAMWLTFAQLNHVQETIDNHNVFSGTLSSDNAHNYRTDVFSALSNKVNLKIGKLKHLSKDDYRLYVIVYPTCFMTEELFVTESGAITAEELAAVLVHELGHALTMIEHTADSFFRADAIKDSITRLTTIGYNPKKDKILTDNITPMIDKSGIDPNKVQKIKKSVEGSLVGDLITGAVSIGVTLVAIFLCQIIVQTFNFLFAITTLQLRLDSISSKNFGNTKTSDIVVTRSNYGYVERLADEFVSRHGLGSALASSLSKMFRFHEIGIERGHSYLGQLILQQTKIFKDFMITPVSDFYGINYDREADRLSQLLENNMVIFKDENLPAEVRDYYIKDTMALIDVIKEYKSRSTVKIKDMFWGILFRIIERKSFVDALITANLSSDYDLLQRMTNGLIRNPMYYHSARLQALLDKNKTE